MRLFGVLVVVSVAGVASAQAPPECVGGGVPSNPTRVCFIASEDHDDVDSYALDLYAAGGALVQTIDMGLPLPVTTANGERWVSWGDLNVMPVVFGQYFARARAIAAGVSGESSEDSNLFDRVPGRPASVGLVDD